MNQTVETLGTVSDRFAKNMWNEELEEEPKELSENNTIKVTPNDFGYFFDNHMGNVHLQVNLIFSSMKIANKNPRH